MLKLKYLVLMLIPLYLNGLTTLNVTLDTDNNPGGQGEIGDLRYWLNSMNQDLNTIPDDYAIVFDHPMTIQLNGNLPIINNSSNSVNITIGNAGSIATTTIDGNGGSYRGFFIAMGNVTIQNIIFQNLTAKGGDGGNGIAGGGGGMGAGGAIYIPQAFLNGSNPEVTLINVSINSCAAVGGNGGSYLDGSATGNEGGGGGGGFDGNGGSVTTTGSTGGGGGGGFGGNGGNVTISTDDPLGGGGGGGGGIGSRATMGTPDNLGNGGDDQTIGSNGNCYGVTITAGTGGGGYTGGINAGGGGGGNAIDGSTSAGGGGGGSNGNEGYRAQGSIPPGDSIMPSGGNGGDGGGGGGGSIVTTNTTNSVDGKAGSGGYGGGGGGGSGTGASDSGYTVQGGSGGIGGGGGGGGVNQSGDMLADGGNSQGGGGGGGGGPSNGTTASGGTDLGYLGGGNGGAGAASYGSGGGGGGGGSGLGAAVFVDSGLNLTIKAFSGITTVFNTTSNTVQAGLPGTSGPDATEGFGGTALGNSIFLRSDSALTLMAYDTGDILTLNDGVEFTDDTTLGGSGSSIFVRGNGTVIYNGTSNYTGSITINNANFKLNGTLNGTSISVCRDIGFSSQRGKLSGSGNTTGSVFANSGTISPDTGSTLNLGSLSLSPANPESDTLGSLVHIEIDASGTSLVAVSGAASLAGTLEIALDESATTGAYTILTASSGITGTFDTITFTGETPNYTLSYLPSDSPTFVQFNFLGYLEPASNLDGKQMKNNFGFFYELYNKLTWNASPSSTVSGYFIYRNGTKIATVSSSTLSYTDNNRPNGASSVYSLEAFDNNGNTSSAITVTIP